MSKLNEGLIQGDLDDLVKPLISIDEYESKISDDNIVVAFYAQDQDPAKDLARFISKSEIDILDAEVSPVPTDEGYYLVFVEFVRDDTFAEDLISLTDSMFGLTSVNKWEFKAYKRELAELSLEALKKTVRVKPKSKTARLESMLMDTANVRLRKGHLIAGDFTYKVLGLGDLDQIMEAYQLDQQPVLLESTDFNSLGRAFGLQWGIQVFRDYTVVVNEGQAILLSKI